MEIKDLLKEEIMNKDMAVSYLENEYLKRNTKVTMMEKDIFSRDNYTNQDIANLKNEENKIDRITLLMRYYQDGMDEDKIVDVMKITLIRNSDNREYLINNLDRVPNNVLLSPYLLDFEIEDVIEEINKEVKKH